MNTVQLKKCSTAEQKEIKLVWIFTSLSLKDYYFLQKDINRKTLNCKTILCKYKLTYHINLYLLNLKSKDDCPY